MKDSDYALVEHHLLERRKIRCLSRRSEAKIVNVRQIYIIPHLPAILITISFRSGDNLKYVVACGRDLGRSKVWQ